MRRWVERVWKRERRRLLGAAVVLYRQWERADSAVPPVGAVARGLRSTREMRAGRDAYEPFALVRGLGGWRPPTSRHDRGRIAAVIVRPTPSIPNRRSFSYDHGNLSVRAGQAHQSTRRTSIESQ